MSANNSISASIVTAQTIDASIGERPDRPVMQIFHDWRQSQHLVRQLEKALKLQNEIVDANKEAYLIVHDRALETQDQIDIDDSLTLLELWTDSTNFQEELSERLLTVHNQVAIYKAELDERTCNGTRGIIYVN